MKNKRRARFDTDVTKDHRHPRRRRVGRHLTVCEATGKVRFRDKREAQSVLDIAAATRHLWGSDGECARRERRSYPCTACKGWHLTSQESYGQNSANDGDLLVEPNTGPTVKCVAFAHLRVAAAARKAKSGGRE